MKSLSAILALCVLLSGFSATAAVEMLRSESIKAVIAGAIEEQAPWEWEVEDDQRGKIWAVSYFDQTQNGYFLAGRPADYAFYITAKKDIDGDRRTDWMEVSVELPCGSEYDESELFGMCEVEVKKVSSRHWKADVKSCICNTTF